MQSSSQLTVKQELAELNKCDVKPRPLIILNTSAKAKAKIVEDVKPAIESFASRKVKRNNTKAKLNGLLGLDTLEAGDLCYVRIPMWGMNPCDDPYEEPVPFMYEHYCIVRVVHVSNKQVPTAHFQFVWCPSRDADDLIKSGTVLKSPYFVASKVISMGKVRQQPHINGREYIHKIPREFLDAFHAFHSRQDASSPKQENFEYTSDVDKDPALISLKHVDSSLELSESEEGHTFVSRDLNLIQSAVRVKADPQRLKKVGDELAHMSVSQLPMLLWGTSREYDLYRGLEGYVNTGNVLPLPAGFAYSGKSEDEKLTTPTTDMSLKMLYPRLRTQVRKYANGFRIGTMGQVWVPIQPPIAVVAMEDNMVLDEPVNVPRVMATVDNECLMPIHEPQRFTMDFEDEDDEDDEGDDNDDL